MIFASYKHSAARAGTKTTIRWHTTLTPRTITTSIATRLFRTVLCSRNKQLTLLTSCTKIHIASYAALLLWGRWGVFVCEQRLACMSSVKRCRRSCKVLVPGKLMEDSTNFVLILCVESAPQWREYKDNFTFVMKKVCRYHWYWGTWSSTGLRLVWWSAQ